MFVMLGLQTVGNNAGNLYCVSKNVLLRMLKNFIQSLVHIRQFKIHVIV